MYALLFVLIAVLLLMVKSREGFLGFLPDAVNVGGSDGLNTDVGGQGQEVYSATPHSCGPEIPDLNAGLCYQNCRSGYHGVGPVCWADSVNVGVGTPVGLEPCPDGWANDGLICREPIGCHSVGDCFTKGRCGCWGGRLKGRLDGGGVCPGPGGGNDHKEKKDGLCYVPCPKDLPVRMPGMPYLCYKGGDLSYGRGAGKVPPFVRIAGKYPIGQL